MGKTKSNSFSYWNSVGKKIGNAVVRNRVKRKIRQAIFELDRENVLIHEADFLVIARKPVVSMSVEECK
ncbi:ribonuclease P protein component, partial [Salmonella enterica]|uniref:ribonuclease P protein component n=1 Tax=Salmonella enterica TaxID=28901 RepID=UPI003F818D0D